MLDDELITVAKPLDNSITGGGYLINTDSAGLYAADDGLGETRLGETRLPPFWQRRKGWELPSLPEWRQTSIFRALNSSYSWSWRRGIAICLLAIELLVVEERPVMLEMVSEPEMGSPAEAVAYAKALHSLVVWLGVCDGNMQEGSFRCDANVSVRPLGEARLGTRC